MYGTYMCILCRLCREVTANGVADIVIGAFATDSAVLASIYAGTTSPFNATLRVCGTQRLPMLVR